MASALSQEGKEKHEDLLEREMLWLQTQVYNGLSFEGLQSDGALCEQYATKLFNYRYLRCMLNYHDQREDPFVLLNIVESFQEERIWLLLNSSPQQPRYRDYEDTNEPYLIHENRFHFYKSMLQNLIQENTFQSENTNEDFFAMHNTLQHAVDKNPLLKHFQSSSDYRYTINSRSEIFYFEELIHGRNYATQDALDGALLEALMPTYRGPESPPYEEWDDEMQPSVPELEDEKMHVSSINGDLTHDEAGAAANHPATFPDNEGNQAAGEENLFIDDEEVGPLNTY